MTNTSTFGLWLDAIHKIPTWILAAGISFLVITVLSIILYQFFKIYQLDIFHAFEKIKLKEKDIERAAEQSMCLEITIPKNSQVTAFQVQQKILKALHAIYADPIEGPHGFSPYLYFFQKLYRRWKVNHKQQVFFTLQIWAQYPSISFRLALPSVYFDRIEKAIFNAYPNAEITVIDQAKLVDEIATFHKSYLSYGQSSIEGQFYHRVKTLKDVSSDPVDSIISTMEGLPRGQFMVYNILLSPASHFFNQIIYFLLEEQERLQALPQEKKDFPAHTRIFVSELISSLGAAMLEKMKASLFQIIISYWVVSPTREEAKARIGNIQAVLTEINQKNMNMLKHECLFTERVEDLRARGELSKIIMRRPVLRRNKLRYWPLFKYRNDGQVVSDSELYSFWHLPNLTNDTVSSVKVTKFKKLPAGRDMREFPENLFIDLGRSNFRMQEETPIGIPTWNDMKKHLYILGGTGSGKSETLKKFFTIFCKKSRKSKQRVSLLIQRTTLRPIC